MDDQPKPSISEEFYLMEQLAKKMGNPNKIFDSDHDLAIRLRNNGWNVEQAYKAWEQEHRHS